MPDPATAAASFLSCHAASSASLHLLVAVSGGPDSCVLLHALQQLRTEQTFPLTVAHFNHGIRLEEGKRDEAFVAAAAEAYGLPCVVGHAAPSLGRDEASMREARYDWLRATAESVGATHVATGHTRDDQVETVLFRLARGTGIDGLTGMQAERPIGEGSDVVLVRPLLSCSREEIEAYAHSHGVLFVTDSTNADERYARNHIRRNILPELRAMQTDADAHIADAASRLAADAALLNAEAQAVGKSLVCGQGAGWVAHKREELLATPTPISSRIIRDAFRRLRRASTTPDAKTVETLLDGLTAKTEGAIDLPDGVRARWFADRLELCRVPSASELAPVRLPVPGRAMWRPTGQHVSVPNWHMGSQREPLALRGWRPGDRWRPHAHGGNETVAETLRALNIPRDRRTASPVLTRGDDVWWVVGARPPADCDPETFHTMVEVRCA